LAGARDQGSKAGAAAATARSTSAASPSGATAQTLPVKGLTESKVRPEAAPTHSPPMNIR
jgi:hypothetical protein